MWKLSYVTPIFKDGNHQDVKNYRAISKISIISKILEGIVAKKITPHFKQIFVPQQHGLVSGKSTVSNLLEYQLGLSSALEDRKQVDVIYTDISEAFDRLSHDFLTAKINALGIHGDLLQWFISYLTNRKQSVKIKKFHFRRNFGNIRSSSGRTFYE